MRIRGTYQKEVFQRLKTVRQKQGFQYAYCANNPINAIDPDGRDWLIKRTQDENGNYIYNITVNGVSYNNSSNSNIDMAALQSKIQEQIGTVFNISGDGFSVNMTLNLRMVTSVDDINSTDHVFQVVDQHNFKEGELADATVRGLNIRIGSDLVESTINGTNNRSIAHELGHTGGLYDVDDWNRNDAFVGNPESNLMTQLRYIWSRKGDAMNARNIESSQINHIWNQYNGENLNQFSPVGYKLSGFKFQPTKYTMPFLFPTFRKTLKK
jgi:hypothetical protein